MKEVQGYLHPLYAASLDELGRPRELPRAGAWILERAIAVTGGRDAMGCYPLFMCRDWDGLPEDLAEIGEDLVSLTAVADPFGSFGRGVLEASFPDLARPFKEHFVADLSIAPEQFLPENHLRNLRKARREVDVEMAAKPETLREEWIEMYSRLVARHRIRGVPAFSENTLTRQLQIPGLVAFRAVRGEETVGIMLWYLSGEVAYYHLAAYTRAGYESRASFALLMEAYSQFRRWRVKWAGLGAGAGIEDEGTDGLVRFKRGWSTHRRASWLCGRIFNRVAYDRALAAAGGQGTSYFPAYRAGEFS